jgi:TonB family protein
MRTRLAVTAAALLALPAAASAQYAPLPDPGVGCYWSVDWFPGETLRVCAVVTIEHWESAAAQAAFVPAPLRGTPPAYGSSAAGPRGGRGDHPPLLLNAGTVASAMQNELRDRDRERTAAGRVIVRVSVDASGNVTARSGEPATPADSMFLRAAGIATRRMRFAPAVKDGRNVAGEIAIPMQWDASVVCGAQPVSYRVGSYLLSECSR